MWFFFALATTLLWGVAELFYKKGAKPYEKYSHLKISMIVGFVMGIHAIFVFITSFIIGGEVFDPRNFYIYLPVTFCYILSMSLSYFGMRFIEESISDPIENTSGALCSVFCVVFLGDEMSVWAVTAVAVLLVGVLGLGFLDNSGETDRKKVLGKKMALVAFAMPFLYALFDAIGSTLDELYLDIEISPLVNVTEDSIELVANTCYEFSFLIVGIIIFIFIKAKGEKVELPKQGDKILAAICETAGQFTYVYAMSGGHGVISAPILSSVCVVSFILSHIFLKERLTKKQYVCVALVIIGILALAIIEGE
ncbi:MAG: EamA family transporter [Lachnospiraceae bacterium]|nr:EamA family transporter [Lachnospiraceae bacterium]